MNKLSRNDPCSCGSGKKYKKCCADKSGLLKHKITMLSPGASSEDKAQKLSAGLFSRPASNEAAENTSEQTLS